MICQSGNPTWFCSFSAAETRWSHRLKILGRLVEKKELNDDEINNMTWKQQLFIKDVLKSNLMAIAEKVDFFFSQGGHLTYYMHYFGLTMLHIMKKDTQ